MDNHVLRHGASRFNPKFILVPVKEGTAGTLSALRTPEMLMMGCFRIRLTVGIPWYYGILENRGVSR